MVYNFAKVICFCLLLQVAFLLKAGAQVSNTRLEAIENEKRDPEYVLDTAYDIKGTMPFALGDLTSSGRLLLDKISKEIVLKFHVKSITLEGEYTEKFDRNGNIIYEEWGSSHSGLSYQYEYNEHKMPLIIAVKDTNNRIIGSAKYKYGKPGKLLQAGPYLFKYYPSGLLKSIETDAIIERYSYDSIGDLNDVKFDSKTGFFRCDNRTSEWKGIFDKNKRLIKEEIIGFPDHIVSYFEYDSTGNIIKSINQNKEGGDESITDYSYTKGLLTEKITSSEGKVMYSEKYLYEFY